jgi:hypothetical protein
MTMFRGRDFWEVEGWVKSSVCGGKRGGLLVGS